jgi:hypothetical protein
VPCDYSASGSFPLIVGITLVSLSSSYYEVLGEKGGLRRDVGRRAEVLGENLAGNVEATWRKIRSRICSASYSDQGTNSAIRCTAAMQAGLTGTIWTMQALLSALMP